MDHYLVRQLARAEFDSEDCTARANWRDQRTADVNRLRVRCTPEEMAEATRLATVALERQRVDIAGGRLVIGLAL